MVHCLSEFWSGTPSQFSSRPSGMMSSSTVGFTASRQTSAPLAGSHAIEPIRHVPTFVRPHGSPTPGTVLQSTSAATTAIHEITINNRAKERANSRMRLSFFFFCESGNFTTCALQLHKKLVVLLNSECLLFIIYLLRESEASARLFLVRLLFVCSMGNIETTETVFCYRGGAVGKFIVLLAVWAPASVWFAIAGVAMHTRLLYVQYISSTWWVGAFVAAVLADVFKQDAPRSICNNGYSMPDTETLLLYQYLVLIGIHRLYWGEPFTWVTWLRVIYFGLFMPAVFVWSGNRTIWQVMVGAGVGSLVAVVCSMHLYIFWNERFRSIESDTFIGSYLGYKDHVPPEQSFTSEATRLLEWRAEQTQMILDTSTATQTERPYDLSLDDPFPETTASAIKTSRRSRASERFWHRIHFGAQEQSTDSAHPGLLFRLLF